MQQGYSSRAGGDRPRNALFNKAYTAGAAHVTHACAEIPNVPREAKPGTKPRIGRPTQEFKEFMALATHDLYYMPNQFRKIPIYLGWPFGTIGRVLPEYVSDHFLLRGTLGDGDGVFNALYNTNHALYENVVEFLSCDLKVASSREVQDLCKRLDALRDEHHAYLRENNFTKFWEYVEQTPEQMQHLRGAHVYLNHIELLWDNADATHLHSLRRLLLELLRLGRSLGIHFFMRGATDSLLSELQSLHSSCAIMVRPLHPCDNEYVDGEHWVQIRHSEDGPETERLYHAPSVGRYRFIATDDK